MGEKSETKEKKDLNETQKIVPQKQSMISRNMQRRISQLKTSVKQTAEQSLANPVKRKKSAIGKRPSKVL